MRKTMLETSLIIAFTAICTGVSVYKTIEANQKIDTLQLYIDLLNDKMDKFNADVAKLEEELNDLREWNSPQEEVPQDQKDPI